MSIPIPTRDQQFDRFAWAIRLSPLLVAIILAALWLAGAASPSPDLRLSAPLVARPGTSIGLRAWQVDEDEQGDTVIAAPAVEVELRNAAGLTLEATQLVPSLVHGREGQLRIPDALDDVFTLVAFAEIEGRTVSVERSLYVREGIESRLPKGRAVNAFQVYELGPIRSANAKRPIRILDPRVEEGACVPDLRCWLVVWVGEEVRRVRLRPLAGVRVSQATVTPTAGFARLPLLVLGSEARVDVELLGDEGFLLAAREVRLPVVPGGIVARAAPSEGRVRVDWEQLGEATPVLVDVFEERRWVNAFSLSPGDPYPPSLGPGVWRLQIRADLFSDNTAGVAYLVVPDPNRPAPLRQAVDAVLAEADREGLDPLALAATDEGLAEAHSRDVQRALFAVPSFDVISVGGGTSSRIGSDEDLAEGQELRRWQAGAMILLIGLVVSMVLLRAELLAQARARQLLDELGDEPTPPSRAVSAGRGLWAFVLLVFVLMALLALSKRWF